VKMVAPFPFEIAFSHFVQSFSAGYLDLFFIAATMLGHPGFWFLLAAALYWKGDERESFFLSATLLFTGALSGGIKEITQRPRPSPEFFRVVMPEAGFSLPSGHAATIGGIYGKIFRGIFENLRLAGIVIVLLVMLSRIYLGVHYLFDVIIGTLLGFGIGLAVDEASRKFSGLKLPAGQLLEEAGIIVAICASVVIAVLFSALSMASGLMGYFAGVFALKLIGKDPQPAALGKALLAREITGKPSCRTRPTDGFSGNPTICRGW